MHVPVFIFFLFLTAFSFYLYGWAVLFISHSLFLHGCSLLSGGEGSAEVAAENSVVVGSLQLIATNTFLKTFAFLCILGLIPLGIFPLLEW